MRVSAVRPEKYEHTTSEANHALMTTDKVSDVLCCDAVSAPDALQRVLVHQSELLKQKYGAPSGTAKLKTAIRVDTWIEDPMIPTTVNEPTSSESA